MRFKIVGFVIWSTMVGALYLMGNRMYGIGQQIQQQYMINKFQERYTERFPDFVPFDSLQQQCVSSLLLQIREIAVKNMAEKESPENDTDYFIDKMHTLREINAYLTARQSFIASIEHHTSLSKSQENVGGVLPTIGPQEDEDKDDLKDEDALHELENIVAYVEDATRLFPALQPLVDRLKEMQTTILLEARLLTKHNAFVSDSKIYNLDWRVALKNQDHTTVQGKQRSRRRIGGLRAAEKIIAHGVIKYLKQQFNKISRRVRREESRISVLYGKKHSVTLSYLPTILKLLQGMNKELNHIAKEFLTTPKQILSHRAKRSVMMGVDDFGKNTHNRLDFNDILLTNTTSNSAGYSRYPLILKIPDFKRYTLPYQYLTNLSTVETAYSGILTLEQFKKISLNITQTYCNAEFNQTPFRDKYCLDVLVEYYPNDNRKMKTTLRYTLCYDDGNVSMRQLLMVMMGFIMALFFTAVVCWSYAYVFKYVSDMIELPPRHSLEAWSSETGDVEPVIEIEKYVFSNRVNEDDDESSNDSLNGDDITATSSY